MPNTFDAALIGSTLADAAIVAFNQSLGPLGNFYLDATPEVMAPQRPVVIPLATGGSSTLTNPADFEAGDTTLGKVTVTPDYMSQPFHVTAQQYQQGFRLTQLGEINAKVFALALWAKVVALIKNNATTGFATANVHVQGLAGFTPQTLGAVYGKLVGMGPRYMLLKNDAMGMILYTATGGVFAVGTTVPEFKVMGFQSVIEHSYWTGADANTYGFGYFKEAIAIAAGIPAEPPIAGTMVDQRTITLPDMGLSIQQNIWWSTKTRSLWASYDAIFGAAIGNPASGVLLKSA